MAEGGKARWTGEEKKLLLSTVRAKVFNFSEAAAELEIALSLKPGSLEGERVRKLYAKFLASKKKKDAGGSSDADSSTSGKAAVTVAEAQASTDVTPKQMARYEFSNDPAESASFNEIIKGQLAMQEAYKAKQERVFANVLETLTEKNIGEELNGSALPELNLIPAEVQLAWERRQKQKEQAERLESEREQRAKEAEALARQRDELRRRHLPGSSDWDGIDPLKEESSSARYHDGNDDDDDDDDGGDGGGSNRSATGFGTSNGGGGGGTGGPILTFGMEEAALNSLLDEIEAEVIANGSHANQPLDDEEEDGEAASEMEWVLQYLEREAQKSSTLPVKQQEGTRTSRRLGVSAGDGGNNSSMTTGVGGVDSPETPTAPTDGQQEIEGQAQQQLQQSLPPQPPPVPLSSLSSSSSQQQPQTVEEPEQRSASHRISSTSGKGGDVVNGPVPSAPMAAPPPASRDTRVRSAFHDKKADARQRRHGAVGAHVDDAEGAPNGSDGEDEDDDSDDDDYFRSRRHHMKQVAVATAETAGAGGQSDQAGEAWGSFSRQQADALARRQVEVNRQRLVSAAKVDVEMSSDAWARESGEHNV